MLQTQTLIVWVIDISAESSDLKPSYVELNMYTLKLKTNPRGDQVEDLEMTDSRNAGDETNSAVAGIPLNVERKRRYKNIVHLWEFLLELLDDESCRSVITWSRKMYGEFKVKNPEELATRWGSLKHRQGMNYDKLSRALRHYYNQGIIKKVHGQRLVYKFHKLPYEYTPKKTRSLVGNAGIQSPIRTIRKDEYVSPKASCSKTMLNESQQSLKENMKKFLEERLNVNHPLYSEPEDDVQIPSPTPSPDRSTRPQGHFQPIIPIPTRPYALCVCGCGLRVVKPIYRTAPINRLPISIDQLDPRSYGLKYGVVPVPVITKLRTY